MDASCRPKDQHQYQPLHLVGDKPGEHPRSAPHIRPKQRSSVTSITSKRLPTFSVLPLSSSPPACPAVSRFQPRKKRQRQNRVFQPSRESSHQGSHKQDNSDGKQAWDTADMANRKTSGGSKKKQKARQRKQSAAAASASASVSASVSPTTKRDVLQPVDTNKSVDLVAENSSPVSTTSSENSKGLTNYAESANPEASPSSAGTTPCQEKTQDAAITIAAASVSACSSQEAIIPDSAVPIRQSHTATALEIAARCVPTQDPAATIINATVKPAGMAQKVADAATNGVFRGQPSTGFGAVFPKPGSDIKTPLGQHATAESRFQRDSKPTQDTNPVQIKQAQKLPNTPKPRDAAPPTSGSLFASRGHRRSATVDSVHPGPENYFETGGIRWAPFNVPFKRRLQTLVVLFHCLSLAITLSVFCFSCVNPLMWPVIIVYMVKITFSTVHSDGTLNRRSNLARRLPVWNLFASYFPAWLHKTADLPPTRKYIFGYHPHGIISHGAFVAFATEALGFSELFPGITNTLLTLDSNFRIPLYRDYILTMGLGSVSKDGIVNILSKGGRNREGMGRAVTIVIGGARESLEARPGNMALVLKNRKGFIRMAVRTGADLVPVLAFGENELYDQLDPQEHPIMRRFQVWLLSAWKFTLPFLHGRGIFNYDVGLMPYRRSMNIVVGRPIKVDLAPRNDAPDNADIDRYHAEYVAELERLWSQYKDRFAPKRKSEMQILA